MSLRIDAHQHFWRYRPETHAWITDSMSQLKHDFLPRDLEPQLAAAGFDGCVAVQAQQNVGETEWLLQLADEHAFIRGVVGWVDLCAANVAEELRRLSAHPRLRGVRHLVQDEADDRFVLRSDFRRGMAALEQFGYKPVEIAKLMKDAAGPADSAETIIRKALKAALRT
jgi:L-fuconolactonase